MLKKCKCIPMLETPRLILGEITVHDVEELRKWLGCDELCTYWGRTVNRDEKNPELLFVDARPHVNRKPSPDYLRGIQLKETHEVIGQIEVFDVPNDRYGMVGYRVAPGLWNWGIGTEAM